MDISTTSLLANQLQTLDPKANAKEAATKIVQESANIPLGLTAQKSTLPPKNAQEIIGHLLSSAVSEAKSKSSIYEILQNNQLFKNMGNFAEDVKTLTNLIKVDSTVAKPLALLQLFSKSMGQIDMKVLQEQVKNSGIFFESKLANSVTQKGVLETIQSLRTEIKEHFVNTNTPLVKEVNVFMERLGVLQELSSKEAQSSLKSLLDLFRQSVKQAVAMDGNLTFKEVYQTVQKLEYAVDQMDLIASKVENYAASMKVEEHFTTHVKVLLALLKENLSALQLDDLAPQLEALLSKERFSKEAITSSLPLNPSKEPASVLQASVPLAKTESPVPLVPSSLGEAKEVVQADVVKEARTSLVPLHQMQETVPASVPETLLATSSPKPPETVEEALQMVVNRIKQQIAFLEPKTVQNADFLSKSTTIEQKIHALIKPELFVGKALSEKLSLDPTDVELLSDMKGVLTKLSDTLSVSPQNKEAFEITNRLLTQIEYHQLFSYVSSSTHLYIPFSWEGLNGGSMMMKQSSDENFHCQIDLDLEQYGKLNMMLLLSNKKYIDISIAAQKGELKAKISQQLVQLKRALNEVGLITGNIKMLEYKDVSAVKNDYFSGEKLQFGINIKI